MRAGLVAHHERRLFDLPLHTRQSTREEREQRREPHARDDIAVERDGEPFVAHGRERSRLLREGKAEREEAAVREMALSDGRVRSWLTGRTVAKVVVVPGRLVNIVTRA